MYEQDPLDSCKNIMIIIIKQKVIFRYLIKIDTHFFESQKNQ